jgi:hypothetical protein
MLALDMNNIMHIVGLVVIGLLAPIVYRHNRHEKESIEFFIGPATRIDLRYLLKRDIAIIASLIYLIAYIRLAIYYYL